MKVEKRKILLYSWQVIETYHQNLAIWKKKSLKSDEFEPFFLWKIFGIGWNHVFQVEIIQKFASQALGTI